MMRDHFVFDGMSSLAFDAWVYRVNDYDGAEKQLSTASIPGRSGDVVLDGYRFGNVSQEYDVVIFEDFDRNYKNLRAFLMSRSGYCRLEDTFHPEEFYEAYYDAAMVPTVTRNGKMGKIRLRFQRKPQRWLKSGERPIVMASYTEYVENDGYFPSYPLVKLNCRAIATDAYISLMHGESTTFKFQISVDSIDSIPSGILNRDLYFDFETLSFQLGLGRDAERYNHLGEMTIYKGTDDSMQLVPGANTIHAYNFVGTREIYPRWYTI